jgi:hypothetical protein
MRMRTMSMTQGMTRLAPSRPVARSSAHRGSSYSGTLYNRTALLHGAAAHINV